MMIMMIEVKQGTARSHLPLDMVRFRKKGRSSMHMHSCMQEAIDFAEGRSDGSVGEGGRDRLKETAGWLAGGGKCLLLRPPESPKSAGAIYLSIHPPTHPRLLFFCAKTQRHMMEKQVPCLFFKLETCFRLSHTIT